MSTWRRKAIQSLPECRKIIDRARTPMAMWIDLHLRFEDAVAEEDGHMVRRFLQYADWCMSDAAGRLPNETSTAVACAFYEHLPMRKEYWPFFSTWFSPGQFAELIPIFSYHLDPDELTALTLAFKGVAGRVRSR